MTRLEVEQFMKQLATRIEQLEEPYQSNLVRTLELVVRRTEEIFGVPAPGEDHAA